MHITLLGIYKKWVAEFATYGHTRQNEETVILDCSLLQTLMLGVGKDYYAIFQCFAGCDETNYRSANWGFMKIVAYSFRY
jgi:hypothetical protein